jgi:hypothetical protein
MASTSYAKLDEEIDVSDLKLEPGDILLKHVTLSTTGTMIAFGQMTTHPLTGSPGIIHAALYLGDGEVAEASGEGLLFNKLSENLRHYKYEVFRYTGKNKETLIKQVFVRVGYSREKKPSYSIKKALSSLFTSKSSKKPDEEVSFLSDSSIFCSGAVVDWYNDAALDLGMGEVFPFKGDAASPQELFDQLNGWARKSENWKFVASIP